jgi:hypothetical protein
MALVVLLLGTATVALFAPAAAGFSVAAEVREPAAWPSWPTSLREVRQWPRRFESYLGDAFPGRAYLIGAGQAVLWKLGALRSSRVVEGQEGWLYLGDAQQGTLEKTRGLFPFTPSDAENWADQFSKVRTEVGALGADLQLVIIPDKQSVYPEFLPLWARPGDPPRKSMADLIVDELHRRETAGVLDLRTVLRAAAKDRQVFWKTDSHWSPAGAYAALESLAPWLLPDGYEHAKSVLQRCGPAASLEVFRGDLIRILGAPGFPGEQGSALLIRDSNVRTNGPWRGMWGLSEPFRVSNGGGRGKLLVLGDSFMDSCWHALSELSSETLFLNHLGLQIPRSQVEKERPAAVLLIIVERLLPTRGPKMVR